jgi:hypothetical protein
MRTYGQILAELDDIIIKKAFIPSPNSQAAQPQSPDGAAGQHGGGMEGLQQVLQQAQAQQNQASQGPPQDPNQAQEPQSQDPNAPPGGDLSPQGMPQSLKNTPVTVTVAELLDLVSGGKASQAHLKTESMKVQHGFKHKKMLRDEQRKEQEEEETRQQEQIAQQQQQQGMMGGGIYSGGAMDGSRPGQSGPSLQPQPGM